MLPGTDKPIVLQPLPKKPQLIIFEQRSKPPSRKPFRIVEVTPTIDGARWRICEAAFTTLGEAEEFVEVNGR